MNNIQSFHFCFGRKIVNDLQKFKSSDNILVLLMLKASIDYLHHVPDKDCFLLLLVSNLPRNSPREQIFS
jgi:hypothetical protein